MKSVWRVLAVLVAIPTLVLGYSVGSRIAAEREADRIVRLLAATTEDGRIPPKVLLHVQRGSPALLRTLDRLVREGPYEYRGAIGKALGQSQRIETLRPLLLELKDGCLDPDAVEAPPRKGFVIPALPPDELALVHPEGAAAVELLAADEDPFLRGWARTFLVATGEPAHEDLAALLAGPDRLLRERASRLVVAGVRLAPGAPEEPFATLCAPTPRGRVIARWLLDQDRATDAVRARAAELAPADRILACDERAVARAARALLDRSEPEGAGQLAVLAARDPGAREALVAAVGSAGASLSEPARAAAVAALESIRR